MKVRDVMTQDVKIASPKDDLQTAARMMQQQEFGILPVAENDRLIGMLSDRDITIRAVAEGLVPGDCQVRDVMSPGVKYVYDDDSIEAAAKAMGDLRIRRLPVLDREKRLVGIVSLGDLAVTRERPAGVALKEISAAAP